MPPCSKQLQKKQQCLRHAPWWRHLFGRTQARSIDRSIGVREPGEVCDAKQNKKKKNQAGTKEEEEAQVVVLLTCSLIPVTVLSGVLSSLGVWSVVGRVTTLQVLACTQRTEYTYVRTCWSMSARLVGRVGPTGRAGCVA